MFVHIGLMSFIDVIRCQVKKQNMNLKRQSMQLMQKIQMVNINFDDVELPVEEPIPDGEQDREVLNKKVESKFDDNYHDDENKDSTTR